MSTPTTERFTGDYVRRLVDDDLDELFGPLSAVLLDGAKGVGKTETALQRAATIRRLDQAPVQQVAAADVEQMLQGDTPVLLDEWQHVPAVWDAVKRAVDRDATDGRFLLTGSMPGQASHSGAGRITVLRMRPLTLAERGYAPSVSLSQLLHGADVTVVGETEVRLDTYVDEILRSGFPGFRHLDGRALHSQLDGYLERIVDREMASAGLRVRQPQTVRGWLRAYAAAVSTVTTAEKIRRSATGGDDRGLPRSTTIPYTETLTALRILDEVPAWSPGNNHLKRLTQGAKHQLADPALAARLVGHGREELLGGSRAMSEGDRPYLGQLFEALATLSVRVFAQSADARVHHLRTRDSLHEVDLIVERADGGVLALEVKLAATVDDGDVRHLQWLKERIADQLVDRVVLTTGTTAYRRQDGVAVVPLALLGP